MLAAFAAVSACSTRGGKIPYDVADFGAPDLVEATDASYDLPLGPLDVVRVSVFQVPDLTGEYQVDSHGFVDVPLLGPLNVRDQRPEQFAETLERSYGQRYLNNPDITVRLITSSNRNITVEGGVGRPGIFSLTTKTTLLGAIALANGVSSETGNAKRVAIFRKRGGQTVAAAFDLTAIRHGETENPLVYPGDTVVVDSNSLRGIYRDLLQTLPLFAIFKPL